MHLGTSHARNQARSGESLTWVVGQDTFALSLLFAGEGLRLARKILLADDSVTAQNMGRKILVDAGYEVITVNNGSAALKRVTESKPDLIVLDVYMPGYSGLEVCQRLKDAPETAHIPVLLTVGKLEPFKPDEARRAQADAHIVKPFEASELLSALARLEDRMVPTDGPRFNTSVSGVERFGGERGKAVPNETDMGWRSRLRFPSKKKKEEEIGEEEAGGNFRDFRKGKGKTAGNGVQAVSSAPGGQEPGLVPDIPRDITPEELDALSALAAKLDGPIPAAEKIAALAEKVGPASVVQAASEEANEAQTKTKSSSDAGDSTPAVAPPMAAGASDSNDAHGASEHDTGDEPKAAFVATENVPESTLATGSTPTVSAGTFVEGPAPIDQQDEPMFAVLPAQEEKGALSGAEGSVVEASGTVEVSAGAEETAAQQSYGARAFDVVGVRPVAEASKEEGRGAEHSTVEAAGTQKDELAGATQAASVGEAGRASGAAEAEGPAPTDEELAEALRLLTPSTAQAEIGIPSHGTLVAAGQMLAEEAARTAGSNPRWVAETVALTQEESSSSLEEEMFRSFAAGPGTKNDAAPTNTVSAIAAVVEDRLAEADKAVSERGFEVQGPAAETKTEVSEVHGGTAAASVDSGLDGRSATGREEAEGSMPSGTFADATLHEEEQRMPVAASKKTEAADTTATTNLEDQSSLEAGGDADMGKQGKPSSSKSGWHQIRKPAGTSAVTDVVETAKQADVDAPQEDSKAMAAAATGEGGSTEPDASAIASIVDSVLADLRPKIVEEIAKKLGKK